MDQTNETRELFGYWYEAEVLCPCCFGNLGRVSPDSVITDEDLEAYFSKCYRCGWALWGLHEYEKHLDKSQGVEKQLDISDDFSDLEKLILKQEIELVSLQLYNVEPTVTSGLDF